MLFFIYATYLNVKKNHVSKICTVQNVYGESVFQFFKIKMSLKEIILSFYRALSFFHSQNANLFKISTNSLSGS